MPSPLGAQLRCAITAGRRDHRPAQPGSYSALAALMLAVCLAGCATTPREVVRRVEVPVAVSCPAPVLPPRPHLPLADLPADASDADIARAAVATLHALTGYAAQVEAVARPTHRSTP